MANTGAVKKVVLYSRVSTSHHGQDPEIQLVALREYARARGWIVVEEIKDHGYSGGTDARPGLRHLLDLVRRRKVDVVAVTKLDRLFRSLRHLVNTLEEFRSVGVSFVSLGDPIDDSPSGRLLLAVLGALAAFEKDLVRERTLAGLAHARRKGKRLGRPPVTNAAEVHALRASGLSLRQIADRLSMSRTTVMRVLRASQNPPRKTDQGGHETMAEIVIEEVDQKTNVFDPSQKGGDS